MQTETQVVAYHPELDIRNTSALPRGTGARYLECVRGEGAELVAKAWRRKPNPQAAVLVDFKPESA